MSRQCLVCLFMVSALVAASCREDAPVEPFHRLARVCEHAVGMLEAVGDDARGEAFGLEPEAFWLRAGLIRYVAWVASRDVGLLSDDAAEEWLGREMRAYLDACGPGLLPQSLGGCSEDEEGHARRGFLTLLALEAALAEVEGPGLLELIESARYYSLSIRNRDLIEVALDWGFQEIEDFFSRYVEGRDPLPLHRISAHQGLALGPVIDELIGDVE